MKSSTKKTKEKKTYKHIKDKISWLVVDWVPCCIIPWFLIW